MKQFFLFFLFFLLIINTLFAEDSFPEQVLWPEQGDCYTRIVFQHYRKAVSFYENKEYAQAKDCYQDVLNLITKMDLTDLHKMPVYFHSLQALSEITFSEKDFERSEYFLFQALREAYSYGLKQDIVSIHRKLGIFYLTQGNKNKAVTEYIEAFRCAKAFGLSDDILSTLNDEFYYILKLCET